MEIYLDNAATTAPCEAAVKAAAEAVSVYGNASSAHISGRNASAIIKDARKKAAQALRCTPDELIFTASGTEANNTVIFGAAEKFHRRSKTVVTSDSEHPSVDEPLKKLESQGWEVIRIPTRDGELDYGALTEALTKKVALVTIMQANNETGALYDIPRIRGIIDRSGCGAFFHSDCVQSFMKTSVRATRYCDAVSVSAHKINGFKGVGALYLKNGTALPAYVLGGGQERGMRSGTENTVGIAAFGAAAAEWNAFSALRIEYMEELRVYLKALLADTFGDSVRINEPAEHICSVLSFTVNGIRSETALNYLSAKGICVSASSACSTHAKQNRVLTAYGLSKEQSLSTLRVGLSYTVTKEMLYKFVSELKAFKK